MIYDEKINLCFVIGAVSGYATPGGGGAKSHCSAPGSLSHPFPNIFLIQPGTLSARLSQGERLTVLSFSMSPCICWVHMDIMRLSSFGGSHLRWPSKQLNFHDVPDASAAEFTAKTWCILAGVIIAMLLCFANNWPLKSAWRCKNRKLQHAFWAVAL